MSKEYKEAIEFLDKNKYKIGIRIERLDDIIILLQQGEAYEKLWELAKPDLADNIKQKYLKDTPKVWQEMADEIIKEVKD